ncbi:hypothetical protein HPP92_010704 [Vanilla planifolia]|uniref:Exocyst subunit Exo70 family protein n=1 Tax=Vanilla planifolia TaxID=51239 RepID=A0A835V3R1_VANPL|nr:hypothetical protein HPP92_010704 [Vanilla planifolia]
MDGAVWPECFAQISDRIMDVFFRFGEGVTESSPEPQKLFKLLEMSAAAVRLRPAIFLLFDDAAPDISSRFRELQKLLVQAASRAFSALEILTDPSPPPPDASVPGVVRYIVNFLKCLVSEAYAPAMAHVLRTESLWKAGFLSRPEPDGSLLREALARVLEALQQIVEAKRDRYRDRVAAQLFAMNSYWYMYMRTRGSELAKIVGEEDMKKEYKAATEEAAYAYQVEAWAPVVRLLQVEAGRETGEVAWVVARGKFEAFVREMEEGFKRHRLGGYKIPEKDLREQIREAVVGMVVPAYAGFLHTYSVALQGRVFPPPDALKEKFGRLFDGGGGLVKAREVADPEPVPEEVDTPGGVRLRARRRMELIRSRDAAERGFFSPDEI